MIHSLRDWSRLSGLSDFSDSEAGLGLLRGAKSVILTDIRFTPINN